MLYDSKFTNLMIKRNKIYNFVQLDIAILEPFHFCLK